MPVISQPHVHAMHGSTFYSFVAPKHGSHQLCGWRLTVAPHTPGTPHVVSHEEILLVTAGALLVELDGVGERVDAGEVLFVPAGSRLAVNTAEEAGEAWVTTSVGFTATTVDGKAIRPPWTC